MILYVLPAVGISGGVAVVLKHASCLIDLGHDVAVLSLSDNDNANWFPGNRVKIYNRSEINYLENRGLSIVFATHYSTVQFVKKLKADRKIYFVQSDERRFDIDDIELFKMCEDSYRSSFEFMTEALWIQRWLKDEFGKDAYYVPNGLDLSLFHKDQSAANSSGRKRILLEGSIAFKFKGMIDAYSAVKDIDADLWIVSNHGKPDKDWIYEKFFEKMPMFEMRKMYSACDVMVKMSRVEGFFGPPLEAMACGCPVVVSKVTGYDEYIRHEHNALVVDRGDVQGAKLAVERILSEPGLADQLIYNGYKTAKEWSWARTAEMLEKVIKGEEVKKFYSESHPEVYNYGVEIKDILLNIINISEHRRHQARDSGVSFVKRMKSTFRRVRN